LAKVVELPEDLEDPFQGSKLGAGGSLHDTPHQKTPGPLGADAGLICNEFSWSTVWSSFISSKTHGGRVSEAYLKAHPEESDDFHVIVG
jgi:hypothetical protein